MAFKTLRVETTDAITTLFLNRPSQRNSVTGELMDDLRAFVEQVRGDETTRAIILTAAGKVFSSGLDERMLTQMRESSPDVVREQFHAWRATLDAFEALPQITLAAVNGPATGAGMVLALACDFRIASTHAHFSVPEVKLGLAFGLGGTHGLTRLVGASAAKEIILRGRNVTAIDAQRMGLVHRIAEPGDVMGLARSWAQRMISYPPRALASAKKLIDQSFAQTANESIEAEASAFVELLQSADFSQPDVELIENGQA
ncbi:MAG: enoyl-CoA hydratase/isomerase family protein [Chloroflexi bacterium]|nr:enoyl-CoA hydratase/isomerase family protein [Chloroflexota bacterium]